MRTPTEDVEAFFAAPRRRALTRRSFAVTVTDGGTLAMVARGDIHARDIEEGMALFREAHRLGTRRRQLVDLQRVRSYSAASMEALVRFHEEDEAYAQGVAREAVVRPGGVLGAFAEGFHRAAELPFEGRAFSSAARAFEWLGDPVGWGPLQPERWLGTGEDAALVAAVEARVVALGATTTVADVATALTTSARTLQRRLRARGEDFRSLRRRALVREAQRALETTDRSIKEIAYDLGFRSPSRLVDAFRRELGTSPSGYREAVARAKTTRASPGPK